jgi:hypothetical protein
MECDDVGGHIRDLMMDFYPANRSLLLRPVDEREIRIPGSAAELLHQQQLREAHRKELSYTVALLAGGCAGTAVDVTLFPIDTLKTRMQVCQTSPSLCRCPRHTTAPAPAPLSDHTFNLALFACPGWHGYAGGSGGCARQPPFTCDDVDGTHVREICHFVLMRFDNGRRRVDFDWRVGFQVCTRACWVQRAVRTRPLPAASPGTLRQQVSA